MKIAGMKRFLTKEKKQDVTLLYCFRDFIASEVTNVNEYGGQVCEQVWLWGDLAFKVTPEDVGKDVVFQTTFINGRNQVTDVIIGK